MTGAEQPPEVQGKQLPESKDTYCSRYLSLLPSARRRSRDRRGSCREPHSWTRAGPATISSLAGKGDIAGVADPLRQSSLARPPLQYTLSPRVRDPCPALQAVSAAVRASPASLRSLPGPQRRTCIFRPSSPSLHGESAHHCSSLGSAVLSPTSRSHPASDNTAVGAWSTRLQWQSFSGFPRGPGPPLPSPLAPT